MADKHSIEERIAHFLKVAEDAGATQAERDLAAEQAERLMIKHGIEETMLPRGEKPREEIVTRKLFFGGAYHDARMMMSHYISAALKLKMYRMSGVYGTDPLSGRKVNGTQVTIVGFESEADDGVRLIQSLDLQAAIAMKAWAKEQRNVSWRWDSLDNNGKTKEKQGFIESFGLGAARRIRETRRQVIQEQEEVSSGTALVLASREQQVNAFYETLNIRTGRTRYAKGSTSSRQAGASAGYNANTGSKSLAGARGAIAR